MSAGRPVPVAVIKHKLRRMQKYFAIGAEKEEKVKRLPIEKKADCCMCNTKDVEVVAYRLVKHVHRINGKIIRYMVKYYCEACYTTLKL